MPDQLKFMNLNKQISLSRNINLNLLQLNHLLHPELYFISAMYFIMKYTSTQSCTSSWSILHFSQVLHHEIYFISAMYFIMKYTSSQSYTIIMIGTAQTHLSPKSSAFLPHLSGIFVKSQLSFIPFQNENRNRQVTLLDPVC